MAKTIEEINEKIRSGSVVVFTAEEIINIARKKGIKKAAQEVNVVTKPKNSHSQLPKVVFSVFHLPLGQDLPYGFTSKFNPNTPVN